MDKCSIVLNDGTIKLVPFISLDNIPNLVIVKNIDNEGYSIVHKLTGICLFCNAMVSVEKAKKIAECFWARLTDEHKEIWNTSENVLLVEKSVTPESVKCIKSSVNRA